MALKIPRKLMPIVKILRKDVKRPTLIGLDNDDKNTGCRWQGMRFEDGVANCCPMGLHPKSVTSSPIGRNDFAGGRCPSLVYLFGMWWDDLKLRDAQQAVRLIWPKKRRHK